MLVNRNISVHGRRTSLRLEPEYWAALADIAEREKITIHRLCSEIDKDAGELNRTAATRLFIVSYFIRLSSAATHEVEQPRGPWSSDVNWESELIKRYIARGRMFQTRKRSSKAASG